MAALFFQVLALTFLAELPDKTSFAAFTLATRHSLWAVFLGGSLAMAVHAAIATMFGALLHGVPAAPLRLASGVCFLLFAVLMLRNPTEAPETALPADGRRRFASALAQSFTAIFLAEWGDLTPFSTATFAASSGRPWVVFPAALLGLSAAVGLMAWLGDRAGRLLRPSALRKIAAAAFGAMGLYLLLSPA